MAPLNSLFIRGSGFLRGCLFLILCEDNKIINDTCEVSEKFNTFFSTVADKIGENIVYNPATHPSIVEIKNHVDVEKNLNSSI
jgi:hypothetical protein